VDWMPAGLWLAVVASGLYHGVNPGMGRPLAVSAGLLEEILAPWYRRFGRYRNLSDSREKTCVFSRLCPMH
jgi:hypothetical protein